MLSHVGWVSNSRSNWAMIYIAVIKKVELYVAILEWII